MHFAENLYVFELVAPQVEVLDIGEAVGLGPQQNEVSCQSFSHISFLSLNSIQSSSSFSAAWKCCTKLEIS